MRILLAILMGLTLSGCGPADPNVKNARERLDAGEIIEFTKPGFREASCRNQKNWELSYNAAERKRIVLGEQQSVMNLIRHTCFQVGSVVGFEKTGVSGKVLITKILWSRIDNKNLKSKLKGKYFQSSERFFKYVDNVEFAKSNMKNPDPYVSIIEFKYLKDSALDEKLVREESQKATENGGYKETVNDGDSLCGCRTFYNDFVVNPLYKPDVLSGKLKSWFYLGEEFYFKQGQRAMLKEVGGKTTPSFATVKIRKIKKVKLSALDQKFFDLPADFDYKAFELFIDQSNSRSNEDWITIVDFDLVNGGEVAP